MIAELRALQAAVSAAGVSCHIGQVPPATPMPYASLSAPGHGVPDDEPAATETEDVAADVRLLVTDTTESNVHARLAVLRRTLAPGGVPAPLSVPGRHVTLQWVRSEFVGTDRDVTVPGTSKHPGFGVDTYRVASQPA